MKTGFYMMFNGKDYFMVSDKKNITDDIACRFIDKIEVDLNKKIFKSPENINFFKTRISKAVCEVKKIKSGRKYYDIHGKDFGGFGTWEDDGMTVIFE